jgi:hypothetical protein
VADRDENPQKRSTARDNHLTVALDARTGSAEVVPEGQTIRDLVDPTRRQQERGDLKLLAGRAA